MKNQTMFFEKNFATEDQSNKRRIVRWSVTFFLIGALQGAIALTRVPAQDNSLIYYYAYFGALTFLPLIGELIGLFRATNGIERYNHIMRLFKFQIILITAGVVLNRFLMVGYVFYVGVLLIIATISFVLKLIKSDTI